MRFFFGGTQFLKTVSNDSPNISSNISEATGGDNFEDECPIKKIAKITVLCARH